MKLRFKGFIIKSIEYHLIGPLKPGQVVSDLSIEDGKIALNGGKKPSIVIMTSAKAYAKSQNQDVNSQELNIKADFVFAVDSKETDVNKIDGPELKTLIETYAMNFCMTKVEELIKQITSIDYGRPLVIQKITMPSGSKISKPSDETKNSSKGSTNSSEV